MTPDQFTYWLQGYAELNAAPPSAEQWQIIRDHLALVFEKRTPVRQPRADMVDPPRVAPFAHELLRCAQPQTAVISPAFPNATVIC